MLVKDIMLRDVYTVQETTTVRELAIYLAEHDISGVCVVNASGELTGIVTEKDIIRHCLPSYFELLGHAPYLPDEATFSKGFHNVEKAQVKDIMTKKVYTVKEGTTISQAAALLISKRVDRLPVLRGKMLVGIIGRKELLKEIANEALKQQAL